jgi:Na+/melibiose symporter-like transporter
LVYSLTISLSNEDETQVSLGNLEVGWCLGTSSGPLFASFFYKIGGYSMPFIVLGLFLFISVFLAKRIDSDKLKADEDNNNNMENTISFANFLLFPIIFLMLIAFILAMSVVTFYYPCLTNHLTNNFNLSVSSASLFFIVPVISYVFILQILDYLSAKFGLYFIFGCGLFVTTISPLFVYPCPPIPKSIISIIIGFLLIGAGTAPVFIPGLVALGKNIRKIDENILFSGNVSFLS